MKNTNQFAKLLGTASVAAFAYAGALSAQQAITDFADYGDTYENWIDININNSEIVNIDSYNELTAEGALGATNTGFDQVAVTQFVNVAAQTNSANDTLIDLSHSDDYDNYDFNLTALNEATAHTTSFDALLGGSQVAQVTFNTAALDIDMAGEDDAAEVALYQGLGGDDIMYAGGEVFARNTMDAAAAYAGTAIIDAETDTWNEDLNEGEGGYENGVQQAALSINTFRLDSEVDTTIELAGQYFSTYGFGDDDIEYSVENRASAYSPTPATSEFVDPRLATDLNDPSISNLDQIAAISINTMSMGNAADEEEEIAASTVDFTIYNYDNSGGDDGDSALGQNLVFGDDFEEVSINNLLVATTEEDEYQDFSALEINDLLNETDGYGDVALNNVSQVAALTMNSISNAGEGTLTLKGFSGEDIDGDDYVAGDRTEFTQNLEDFDYNIYDAENFAVALTDEGEASINGIDQVALYGFNAISSGGNLNGYNDYDAGEDGVGITQIVEDLLFAVVDFDSEEFDMSARINYIEADSDDMGNSTVADASQVMQMRLNTVTVGGDMSAQLDQIFVENDEIEFDGEINLIDSETDEGNATLTNAEQIALFSINTASVDGHLDSTYLDQLLNAEGVLDFEDDEQNQVDVDANYGNAVVSGLDQIAQFTFNSVSAGSAELDSYQEFTGLEWLADGDNSINKIDVESDDEGDANISDSIQTFILNANSLRVDDALTGNIAQDVDYVDSYDYGEASNYAYAWADQDLGDSRWVGGNASINGLTQTLSMSFNSVSAGSLDGATIDQYASYINIEMGNYAYADAEYGAASITGVSQLTINRVNTISITPVSLD